MDRPKLQGFRFSPRVNETMDWLTDRLSMGRTDVISLAIRKLAQAEGMEDSESPGKTIPKRISRKSGK